MRQKTDATPHTGMHGFGAPLDRAHLSRQAMNDPALEREVLATFVRQARIARSEIPQAKGPERSRLAHRLKGAAEGVGAFAVADCAGVVEGSPDDEVRAALLAQRIDELADFVETTILGLQQAPR